MENGCCLSMQHWRNMDRTTKKIRTNKLCSWRSFCVNIFFTEFNQRSVQANEKNIYVYITLFIWYILLWLLALNAICNKRANIQSRMLNSSSHRLYIVIYYYLPYCDYICLRKTCGQYYNLWYEGVWCMRTGEQKYLCAYKICVDHVFSSKSGCAKFLRENRCRWFMI